MPRLNSSQVAECPFVSRPLSFRRGNVTFVAYQTRVSFAKSQPAHRGPICTRRPYARITRLALFFAAYHVIPNGCEQVRVCWHFVLDCTPVVARPLHVDGISIYSLSVKGLVRRHDIETVVVNGTPAKPPFVQAWVNVPSWISRGLVGRGAAPGLGSSSGVSLRGISSRVGAASVAGTTQIVTTLHGQRWARLAQSVLVAAVWKRHTPFVRRALVEASHGTLERTGGGAGGGDRGRWAAAGGTELSDEGPAPSVEGDQEGKNVSNDSNSKDVEGDEEDKKTPPKGRQKKKKGFWPIEIGGPLGCETSWDCTGGYVCCDLIVVKICCSNGVMQPKRGDRIPVLLPIPGRGRTELDQITVT